MSITIIIIIVIIETIRFDCVARLSCTAWLTVHNEEVKADYQPNLDVIAAGHISQSKEATSHSIRVKP